MLIAHRGIHSKKEEENKINAFKRAINDPKYKGFELDIYTSKDKEFIVHHDPLLDNKFIWDYTVKELKKKGIPTLIDVLKLKTDKIILIEIKDIKIDIDKLTKLLNRYRKKNIYVMSFYNSVIRKFKDNKFKIGLLNYVLNSSSIYTYDFIGILYGIASNYMIDSFKKLDIEVFLYGLTKKDKLIYKDIYYIVDSIYFF